MNIDRFYEKFQQIISLFLLFTGMFFVTFEVLELIWEIIRSFSERIPKLGLGYAPQYAKTIFILFFNTLLTLEILETIKVFNKDHEIKIRVVLLVCLIAVSRKILAMDAEGTDPLSEFSSAALILSLSVSYLIVKDRFFFKKKTEE